MTKRETSSEIYQRVASYKDEAPIVQSQPLRPNPYVQEDRSITTLVRTDNRIEGIEEAINLLGGITPALSGIEGHALVKPNCNSYDSFPGSTHPETLEVILQTLLKTGLSRDRIVVGDMSGPMWLPTRKTMEKNGILDVVNKYGVKSSFFDEENWVSVRPDKATTWPEGFTLAKTVHEASRIISLPCLKTHRFGGVFSLSLKNAVGMINPADRMYLHSSKKMRDLIAEINLAFSSDLIILDGMKCFVSGGPEKGEKASPGLIIAGSDRVATDVIGTSVLKYLGAHGIAENPVNKQEQLRRAAEIGLGYQKLKMIELRTSNLTGDENFLQLVQYIKKEIA